VFTPILTAIIRYAGSARRKVALAPDPAPSRDPNPAAAPTPTGTPAKAAAPKTKAATMEAPASAATLGVAEAASEAS
jgi:hypothetical protein